MQKMKKRAGIAIPVLVVIIAVLYVTIFRQDEDTTRLVLSGNIEVTDAQLGFRIPGTLAERLFDEGESVTQGQVLARLSRTDQELIVSMAEANLVYVEAILAEVLAGSRPEEINRAGAQVNQARAVLEELLSGSRAQEIADAEANLGRAEAGVAAAESQLDLARSDFDRFRELYDAGVITEREYEASETQLEVAASNLEQAGSGLESAREMLSLRREGARPEQIDQARANLGQAAATYELVLNGPRPETVEQARAQVAIANETVRQARQQLEYTQLSAPWDGVILSMAAEPGEYLNPGTPVFTIGRLDEVWLRAYVNETNLGRINLGQVVEVTTDTYPDRVYEGTISFISSEAEFTPKAVQTFEERVKLMYMVKVLLENPNHELKPGMPADAVISTSN